jgi:hypothetical protein
LRALVTLAALTFLLAALLTNGDDRFLLVWAVILGVCAWAKTLRQQLVLTERSRTSVSARHSDKQQNDIKIATVADTPHQLQSLINDKPQYWVWAAFASMLVQRRNALQHLLNDHRNSVAPAPPYNEDQLERIYQQLDHLDRPRRR